MPSEVATIAQTITVPVGASTLQVHQGMASYERTCSSSSDRARFLVDGVMQREWVLCNRARWATMAEYDTLEFDVSAFAGQSVTLAFQVQNGTYDVSSWYIDTVRFISAATNTSPRNADFAVRGDGSWYENSRERGAEVGQMVLGGVAKLGSYLENTTNNTSRRVSQYVTIPASTRSLQFTVVPRTLEFCGAYYDVLNIEVNEVVVGRIDICKTQRSGPWSVDLSAYANTRVKIGFDYVTDSSLAGEVTIDDVAFSTDAASSIRAPLALLATPKTFVINRMYQK
jgi:hypothetical protein